MKSTLLATLLAALFSAPSLADEGVVLFNTHDLLAEADAGPRSAEAWRQWGEDFSRDIRASLGTMFAERVGSGKVVKGAPYSAEIVTEASQSLADGNVISRKTSARVYRDGEGRTRQESSRAGKEPTIYISDPVEGKSIVLTPEAKRAIVIPRASFRHEHKDKQVFRVTGTEIRIEDGKVFIDGKESPDGKVKLKAGGKDVLVENGRITIDGKEIGADGGRRVIVKKLDEKDTGDGTHREEVRIQVVRAGDGRDVVFSVPPVPPTPPVPPVPPGASWTPLAPLPPIPSLPGASTMRFESIGKLGKGVTTALGMKDFDGVKAEGKSTVWTIPAGEIGNRNAIMVSSESWYSPELQLTVYSRYHDPRQGESIYRLSGIRRGEPGADLFKVPEGYEVKGRAKKVS